LSGWLAAEGVAASGLSSEVAEVHEADTLEQLKPTITRLAQRLMLADRSCGPPRAERATYTTHLNRRGHKPRVHNHLYGNVPIKATS
jgi:hypothetical protein